MILPKTCYSLWEEIGIYQILLLTFFPVFSCRRLTIGQNFRKIYQMSWLDLSTSFQKGAVTIRAHRDISIFSWYVLPWRVPGENIFVLNFSLSTKCNSKLLPAYVLPVGKMSSYKIFWNVKNIPAGVLPKKVQVEVFPCRPPTNGQNVRLKNMSKCQLLFCCDKRVNGQGISSGIWFGNRVNGQGISSGIW